jgi:hypothetical protein
MWAAYPKSITRWAVFGAVAIKGLASARIHLGQERAAVHSHPNGRSAL